MWRMKMNVRKWTIKRSTTFLNVHISHVRGKKKESEIILRIIEIKIKKRSFRWFYSYAALFQWLLNMLKYCFSYTFKEFKSNGMPIDSGVTNFSKRKLKLKMIMMILRPLNFDRINQPKFFSSKIQKNLLGAYKNQL